MIRVISGLISFEAACFTASAITGFNLSSGARFFGIAAFVFVDMDFLLARFWVIFEFNIFLVDYTLSGQNNKYLNLS
jgi:hypothetical protein